MFPIALAAFTFLLGNEVACLMRRSVRSLGHSDFDIANDNISADYKLSMDLLRNYPDGYNVLPTANPHDVVNVTLQMALYHIVDMNERAQTLTTNCEIITKWHDVFLMWNPKDYDNITDTRLPWERVWTPDIVLYNAAGDGEQGREMRTLIQVDYLGNVTLLTQAIYMSKCTIDVTYYPFDAQMCNLKFASWTTEVTRINISIGTIDKSKILGLYSPSGVFELKRIYAERHEVRDPCCEDKFADVTYTLVIWRRPKFFLFNYIQPAVLINILALFVFLIPAESGEKITLGISTMLNMTVFLMTVTSGIPPTDQTPILSIYYATVMVLTTAATVMGVIVLRIHHQGRRGIPVPLYLRRTAQWMALVTFYRYPPIEKQLENLNNGMYSAVPQSDSYCYNIKEELGAGKKRSSMPFNKLMPAKKKSPKCALDKKGLVNGKLANSPRFRPKSKVNAVYECENSNKKSISVFSKTTDSKNSDNEYSDIKTEDEETPLQKPKPSMLWKKVSKNVEEETNKKEEKKDPWKDLGTLIMEERYKAEERKEIIGEEWRKISRIFDRFLLVVFTFASLISTVWCIFTSPHFPDPDADDDRIAMTRRR
eukprot:TRINITY_DN34156_c0_g1_i1.p1 TRINITY_DN34156_c0_g1~~TRINITY_DN34156_c0_g1_i1.p1  ORF type:complete len:596 (-),score=103.65 TRINITY_DN34156_c0_g1_i1:68-1855(-)